MLSSLLKRKIRSGIWLVLCSLLLSCDSDDVAPTSYPPTDPWWNDDVFYEVFVRSFYDSDGNGHGDIQGLIQKLDYLNDGNPETTTDLGVTGIWLMPIFPSPSYHGYDVTDYRTVNTQYGSLNDFKELVTAAHARGIKVIIDFVINHTSSQHPWFLSSDDGAASEKRNWYIWQNSNPGYLGPWGQQVWHPRNSAYYYGIFWSGMPDLNYKEPDVTEEIKDITTFWFSEIHVDGFRIDAAKHLIEEGHQQENTQATLNWWRDFYVFQKNLDPGLMSVGEVWTTTQNILPYTDHRLDYCFEFDLANSIIITALSATPAAVKNKMEEIVDSYPELQYGTFLTNHDQNRVIETLGGDVNKAKLVSAILLTLPGVPYLYYGEEVGMKGVKPDEDIRRPMQWTAGSNAGFTSGAPWRAINSDYATANVETMQGDPLSLWNHYQKLIRARTTHDALRHGTYESVDASASAVLTYLRTKDDERVLVIHNLDDAPLPVVELSGSLPEGTYSLTDILSGDDLGTLVVSASGVFSDFIPYDMLEAYTTYLVKVEKI